MNGKERCRILKSIRRDIARENQIPFEVNECTHTGECKGTCPKCESEMRYLEERLRKKKAMGRNVILAGISAATMLSMTGCTGGESIPELMQRLTGQKQEEQPGFSVLDGEIVCSPEGETDIDSTDSENLETEELDGDVAYEEQEEVIELGGDEPDPSEVVGDAEDISEASGEEEIPEVGGEE